MTFSNSTGQKPPSPRALEEMAARVREAATRAPTLRPDGVHIVSREMADRIEAEGTDLETRRTAYESWLRRFLRIGPALLVALLLASPAGAEKKLRPSVCLEWELYRSNDGHQLAVCTDGGKRYLMGRAKLVVLDGLSGPERVLVGYRGAQ